MEEQNRKFNKARVLVRVRPFTEAEGKICPEDSPVPREIIQWDGYRSLSVLDAANGFHPRKNGQFEMEHVLWSFRDEEQPKVVVHSQKDVYDAVVKPMIPQILEGYNSAFCIAGASGSGRVYSLYGDDVDGSSRGILPRFAEEIFTAFKAEKRENTTLSCEVEAVDISSNETYVDPLLQPGRRNAAGRQDELKLVHDSLEGTKLQDLTRVPVNKASDVLAVLRQLARVVPKRNGPHTVHFRFVETFEFSDPEQMGQVVSKSRRMNVLFVLLRNMPAAFQRCIDVAVEHDSGENPLAKVPTRETAFTKLYPELLQQGYNLTFLCCVSPFYGHGRDTNNTLVLATKFAKLKCRPKLIMDNALMELRLLADEVKHLNTEVVRQTESVQIVQNELNAREVELMKKEAAHHECRRSLEQVERKLLLAKHALAFNRFRTAWHKKNFERLRQEKKKVMETIEAEKRQAEQNALKLMKEVEILSEKSKNIQREIDAQKSKNATLEAVIKSRDQQIEDMEKMRIFISSSQEERKRIIEASSMQVAKAENPDSDTDNEIRVTREKGERRCRQMENDYAFVHAAERWTREKEEIKGLIQNAENEISDVELEIWRLQEELERRPKGCQCNLM